MGRKSTWKLGTKVRWFLRDLPPGGGSRGDSYYIR